MHSKERKGRKERTGHKGSGLFCKKEDFLAAQSCIGEYTFRPVVVRPIAPNFPVNRSDYHRTEGKGECLKQREYQRRYPTGKRLVSTFSLCARDRDNDAIGFTWTLRMRVV